MATKGESLKVRISRHKPRVDPPLKCQWPGGPNCLQQEFQAEWR